MSKALLALAVSLTLCANAYAIKIGFGDDERIERIADTNLTIDRSIATLSQKVTTKWFLLPYTVSAELVLTKSGSSGAYYDLPSGAELKRLQAEGALPDPLPTPQIGLMNNLLGNSLWIAIIVIVGSAVVPILRQKNKKDEEPSEKAEA